MLCLSLALIRWLLYDNVFMSSLNSTWSFYTSDYIMHSVPENHHVGQWAIHVLDCLNQFRWSTVRYCLVISSIIDCDTINSWEPYSPCLLAIRAWTLVLPLETLKPWFMKYSNTGPQLAPVLSHPSFPSRLQLKKFGNCSPIYLVWWMASCHERTQMISQCPVPLINVA